MNPKTTMIKFALTLLSLTWLAGCGSASLKDHVDTTPELKLETFFNGELMAYGMVLDRSGNLLRRFDAKLIATWDPMVSKSLVRRESVTPIGVLSK